MQMRAAGLAVTMFGLLGLMGCGGGKEANPNALTGKVTANGQPVKTVTMVVTGPDGKTAGGTTNDEGVYTIPEPPQGKLQFVFVPPGGKAAFPVKYTKPGNGLSFEYTKGKQKYDIELTP